MLNVDLSMFVTVLYVILLYLFLTRFFFRPITTILKRRREFIEGRLEESRKRLEIVEQKTSEYEQTMRSARSEAYRHQELQREGALVEKTQLVAKAKTEAEHAVHEARGRLAAEAAAARQRMSEQVDTLAKQLTTAILRD
jgi:F-type H+-transporting ATPase subunit b